VVQLVRRFTLTTRSADVLKHNVAGHWPRRGISDQRKVARKLAGCAAFAAQGAWN